MADSTDTWRVFIAIELPPDVRARLSEHITHLRTAMPEVRASWGRKDNIHLTLKFLGEIPVARVAALSEATQRVARTVERFELTIEGCGSFPPHGQPRVLWIGIGDPSARLAQLHEALENECANAGFAREPRSFHPHLTIARLRQPHDSRQLAQLHGETGFKPEKIVVSEVLVIRSKLSSEGAQYSTISLHTVG